MDTLNPKLQSVERSIRTTSSLRHCGGSHPLPLCCTARFCSILGETHFRCFAKPTAAIRWQCLRLVPAVCNLYLSCFDQFVVERMAGLTPYFRYIDDGFGVLDTSVADFDTVPRVVNSWNTHIRIQAIERDREVPYFHLAVSKLDEPDERGLFGVMHRTCRKKLNIYGYVSASSQHHAHMAQRHSSWGNTSFATHERAGVVTASEN